MAWAATTPYLIVWRREVAPALLLRLPAEDGEDAVERLRVRRLLVCGGLYARGESSGAQ